MLMDIFYAVVAAVVVAPIVPVEIIRRPYKYVGRHTWYLLTLPWTVSRLDRAVEKLSWFIASDEANSDVGGRNIPWEDFLAENRQTIHDTLSGRTDWWQDHRVRKVPRF